MRPLFIFFAFCVLVFGLVCDKVDESRDAFLTPRKAKLVELGKSGRAILEDNKGNKYRPLVLKEQYKVGDMVPIWADTGSPHNISERTSEDPFPPSKIPMYCYGLAVFFALVAVFSPSVPKLAKMDTLSSLDAQSEKLE